MVCNHIFRMLEWNSIRDINNRIVGWNYKKFCIKCDYIDITEERLFDKSEVS